MSAMNKSILFSILPFRLQFQPPQFSDVYQTPPVVSMEMLHAQTDLIEAMQDFLKKYDHIPHNEKSIKLLLAEEKFLKIKQVVEEEQTQPEYLQELLQKAEELRKSEARARFQKIIIDDDDDNLGFYAVHPNTIHTPVSQNIEPKDSLIMGDGHINTTRTETISVETCFKPNFSDDSMILSEYESFTFDDEPVMAEVNVFDEINTSELSYPGIGENVVLDEEEDTFTFTTRSFIQFVTYPEVFRILEDSWLNLWKDKAMPTIPL
ncbi:hypothetical protein Tco_0791451 [Tanacetum coccineum]